MKFDRAVNFAMSSDPVGNVKVFLALLEEAWKEMSTEEGEELLEIYLEVKSAFMDKLEQVQVQVQNTAPLACQLAEIQGYEKLPIFSEKFEEWIGFRDSFMLEVGCSKVLEPKNKLRRLMSCLSGRAKRVVGNWEFIDENYELAWRALVEEFENPDMALKGHLESFLRLKQCRQDNVEDLKELMDIAKGKQRDIMTMHEMSKERLGDILWKKEVEQRLDEKTKTAWLMSTKKGKIATCEKLYDFLAQRARAVESSKPNTSSVYIKREQRCFYCSGGHVLSQCQKFTQLSILDRRNEVARLRCCFVCLKPGHRMDTCSVTACLKCP